MTTDEWGMGAMGCMAAMWIVGLLLLTGVVVLAVVLAKKASGPGRGGRSRTSADRGAGRKILEERFARGELSADEYRERLRTLEEDHPG